MEKHYNEYDDDNDLFNDYYFHNKSIFAEVLIRLNLLANWTEPKLEGTICSINQDVTNTEFQFESFLSVETLHMYEISLRLDDLSISFDHFGIQHKFDEHLYLPKTMVPYFSYLYSLDKKLKKHPNFSLINSIKCWDDYVTSITHTSFLSDIYKLKIDLSTKPKLEIDRNSPFIRETDAIVENIHSRLIHDFKNKLNETYGVSHEIIQNYAEAVGGRKYNKMKSILHKVDFSNKKAIDLFFEITESPFIDDILIANMSNSELKLRDNTAIFFYTCSKEQIINYNIELRKTMESLSDDDYCDFDLDKWFDMIANRDE